MYKPNQQEVTCIVCPVGCKLTVVRDEHEPEGYRVLGSQCKRGEHYGIKEVTNPTRMLPTTMAIKGAHLPRIPVRTAEPIPKAKIFDCMDAINRVELEAPIKIGEVVLENVAGTGVDVIATRSMARVTEPLAVHGG